MSDEVTQLRGLLGERIPSGGNESDTMFSDVELQEMLDKANQDMDRAAYEGWRAKAAEFANLVDTTEGNYSRKFGQLLDNANTMARLYSRAGGSVEGRTRIGRIRRAEDVPPC